MFMLCLNQLEKFPKCIWKAPYLTEYPLLEKMTNVTFKDVRTLPILRVCVKTLLLLCLVLYVYFMFMMMFTFCFTKAEGQVRTIPQNAGLNSAAPFILRPLFWEYPTMCLYLTQSVQLYPSMTTRQFKKKKEHKN